MACLWGGLGAAAFAASDDPGRSRGPLRRRPDPTRVVRGRVAAPPRVPRGYSAGPRLIGRGRVRRRTIRFVAAASTRPAGRSRSVDERHTGTADSTARATRPRSPGASRPRARASTPAPRGPRPSAPPWTRPSGTTGLGRGRAASSGRRRPSTGTRGAGGTPRPAGTGTKKCTDACSAARRQQSRRTRPRASTRTYVATWIVRGDESRRRRGRGRGHSAETSRGDAAAGDVDSPRRRVAATPRPRTWTFRGDRRTTQVHLTFHGGTTFLHVLEGKTCARPTNGCAAQPGVVHAQLAKEVPSAESRAEYPRPRRIFRPGRPVSTECLVAAAPPRRLHGISTS